jgi:RDD family
VAVNVSNTAYTLAWRRTAAWAVDWVIISVYAGALVPVGLLLVDRSVGLPSLAWNAVSFVVLIVPATVWLGRMGRRPFGRQPGKHLLGLRVRMAHPANLAPRLTQPSGSRTPWLTGPDRISRRCPSGKQPRPWSA